MSALLEVSGISVSFDGFSSLNNLSFWIGPAELHGISVEAKAGELTYVIGTNGMGQDLAP